ncbi:MAG: acyltransferase domain-containing protein [Planctomycetales bacterium]|nr:acyltransferase domain-containing protein [Planctomycetales bacterium]
MGQELVQRSPLARGLFEQAGELLGFDLLEICTQGPAERLNRTEYCQPALFVHSFAALKQLELERPELWDTVAGVAGLSLGEYTAVTAAGGMSFESAVQLVHIRGLAMQAAADATASGMSSILGLSVEPLDAVCQQAATDGQVVRVANLLCPGNIAISGHLAALERAEQLSLEAGAFKAVRLQVAGAFHTPVMQPAVERLEQALATVEFQPTRVPVFSNVDASPHSQPAEFRRLLAQQVVEPVRWEASLNRMVEAGCEQFLEIGAGRVLAGTLKRINRKLPCENIGN